MAKTKEILYSPIAEARYAFLIDPRQQLDPEKPKAWSCQLIFPAGDPGGQQMLEAVRAAFKEHHGKATPADKGIPIRPDKNDPTILVARFKSQQNFRDDGTPYPGPTVVDSRRQPWDGSAIGNGSRLRLAYFINPWTNVEGAGLTLIPTAAQVVEHVAYNPDGGASGFDEVPGGAVAGAVDAADGFDDEEPPF